MAAFMLKRLRGDLIKGLSKGVINDLVDKMLDHEVINNSEKEDILEANSRTGDQARSLLDTIKRKGARASQKFIEALKESDNELATNLRLDCPAGKASTENPVYVRE
uniref:CARD domain-containing protein n=1 Tax=Callorhinchus milii TaxID=7868 RepID=A0A4W3I8X0_CALMI